METEFQRTAKLTYSKSNNWTGLVTLMPDQTLLGKSIMMASKPEMPF